MIQATELDRRIEQHRQEILTHFDSALALLVGKLADPNFAKTWAKIESTTLENSTPFAVSSDFKVSLLDIINLPGYEKLRELCAERKLRLKIEMKNEPVINEGLIWPTLLITISKTDSTTSGKEKG